MKIVLTLKVEGIHRWADCPYEDVEYLRETHRHIFHIKMWKEVKHDDRDIELIRFKRSVERSLVYRYYATDFGLHDFDTMSCEMIARELYNEFTCSAVEVLEDGENGALYEGD